MSKALEIAEVPIGIYVFFRWVAEFIADGDAYYEGQFGGDR